MAGIDQSRVPGLKLGGNVVLTMASQALKSRDDDASSIISTRTDHRELGKRNWAGGKAGEFKAGQISAFNRAVKKICLGKLKARVAANLFCGPAPGGQPI